MKNPNKTIELEKWSEFKTAIDDIRDKYEKDSSESPVGRENRILFRGQSNSDWSIKTTLEREEKNIFSIYEYFKYVENKKGQIEDLTKKKWNNIDLKELKEKIKKFRLSPTMSEFPYYKKVAFLRHYGFPSPLLDWTECPLVAAYFAYCATVHKCVDRVAIYCFIEKIIKPKVTTYKYPRIVSCGHYIDTSIRHESQKSWYTLALEYSAVKSEKAGYYCGDQFCSHNEIYKQKKELQDIIIKITLPASESSLALDELNKSGINKSSLFPQENNDKHQ